MKEEDLFRSADKIRLLSKKQAGAVKVQTYRLWILMNKRFVRQPTAIKARSLTEAKTEISNSIPASLQTNDLAVALTVQGKDRKVGLHLFEWKNKTLLPELDVPKTRVTNDETEIEKTLLGLYHPLSEKEEITNVANEAQATVAAAERRLEEGEPDADEIIDIVTDVETEAQKMADKVAEVSNGPQDAAADPEELKATVARLSELKQQIQESGSASAPIVERAKEILAETSALMEDQKSAIVTGGNEYIVFYRTEDENWIRQEKPIRAPHPQTAAMEAWDPDSEVEYVAVARLVKDDDTRFYDIDIYHITINKDDEVDVDLKIHTEEFESSWDEVGGETIIATLFDQAELGAEPGAVKEAKQTGVSSTTTDVYGKRLTEPWGLIASDQFSTSSDQVLSDAQVPMQMSFAMAIQPLSSDKVKVVLGRRLQNTNRWDIIIDNEYNANVVPISANRISDFILSQSNVVAALERSTDYFVNLFYRLKTSTHDWYYVSRIASLGDQVGSRYGDLAMISFEDQPPEKLLSRISNVEMSYDYAAIVHVKLPKHNHEIQLFQNTSSGNLQLLLQFQTNVSAEHFTEEMMAEAFRQAISSVGVPATSVPTDVASAPKKVTEKTIAKPSRIQQELKQKVHEKKRSESESAPLPIRAPPVKAVSPGPKPKSKATAPRVYKMQKTPNQIYMNRILSAIFQ